MSSSVEKKLTILANKFGSFEEDLNLNRSEKQQEATRQLHDLQSQISQLQLSLALESKNRSIGLKAVQEWLGDQLAAFTAKVEALHILEAGIQIGYILRKAATHRALIMAVVAVAIIGKLNEPLFVRIYDSSHKEEIHSIQYHLHASLDIVDERVQQKKGSGSNSPLELYLGQLFAIEDIGVYGCVTNSKMKFIAVIRDVASDINLKAWFRDMHHHFIIATSNPFYNLNDKIDSKLFEQTLAHSVLALNNQLSPTATRN